MTPAVSVPDKNPPDDLLAVRGIFLSGKYAE
jgi:hypothetical protein